MSHVTFVATGDSFITRRLPDYDEEFARLATIIHKADVRFTNLETVIRRNEGFPSAQSGGTWATTPPEVLEDLRAYGFNTLNLATNHTLDYSYGGLQATMSYLRQYDFIYAGAGEHMAAASAPSYIECPHGRVAMIAATSSCPAASIAGEQRRDAAGRPGVNSLRYNTVYRVHPDKIEALKKVAQASQINAPRELAIQNGFIQPDSTDVFRFGRHIFVPIRENEQEGRTTYPHAGDAERLYRAIDEAKRQADVVLVSLHSHEFQDDDNEKPADFFVNVARTCIDHGAHAIIGHGPHIVRGIEIYKNRPIFYSLGNFIFQSDTVRNLPADYYEKYGLGPEHHVAEAFDKRSANDTRGYAANAAIWSSVIASWTMKHGELTQLTLYPIALGFKKPRSVRGWPQLTDDTSVLHTIQRLSELYGTQFTIRDEQAVWSR